MADAERLLDLLVEWEDRRQRGEDPSAAELCPDDPALQEALRQRIRKRQKFHAILDDPASTLPVGAASEHAIPRIAGYEIVDVIGAGGMGVVYKAIQTKLARTVALKMILSGPIASGPELQRFRTEAEAVARLQHPGIVQIFEIGEQDQRPYLALEFVAGGSLAQRLKATPMPPQRVAELLLHLARAIHHAHELGVIHRDLKPANILLTEQGIPKIADFGLAKRLDQDHGNTMTGAILGSPSYMAPEQAEGQINDITPATDIYAVGAILYEMLTGRPPFNGTSVLQTLEQVRTLEPVSPKILQPGIPKDLEVICLKCLEKKPEDRYASALALANDLERFLAGEPIEAKAPTLREGIERMLRRNNFDASFRSFANWLIVLSPFPLVIHLAVYWLLLGAEHYPAIITATSIVIITAFRVILFLGMAPALRFVPARERRQFTTVWIADAVGVLIIWLILWLALTPDRVDLMFLVYPLCVMQLGNTFFAFAVDIGRFYVTGIIYFILGLVLVFFLPWTPLIVGVLMFTNMLGNGLMLRHGFGAK